MEELARVPFGDRGMPGTEYDAGRVTVARVRPGRYALEVVVSWGSNQGYLEEHGRVERRYRAATLDDLLRVAQAELSRDPELSDEERAAAQQAVRDAVFEAEDAENAETE